MYHQEIEEVADIEKSCQWLDKAGLKDRAELLIIALTASLVKASVYHTRQNARCRLCKDAHKIDQYLSVESNMLEGRSYIACHNQVAVILHRNISVEYGLEVTRSKWSSPPKCS